MKESEGLTKTECNLESRPKSLCALKRGIGASCKTAYSDGWDASLARPVGRLGEQFRRYHVCVIFLEGKYSKA